MRHCCRSTKASTCVHNMGLHSMLDIETRGLEIFQGQPKGEKVRQLSLELHHHPRHKHASAIVCTFQSSMAPSHLQRFEGERCRQCVHMRGRGTGLALVAIRTCF